MEIRRPGGEPTQNRSLELADVCPLAGFHGSTGIGRLDHFAGCDALQRIERHIRGAARCIGQADVQRRLDRMIAGVRRVVARRARPRERIGHRDAIRKGLVVQTGDAGDHDRFRVEDLLAAGDRAARSTDVAVRLRDVQPRIEDIECTRVKCRACRVHSDRVVDADVERLSGQRRRSALRTLSV